MTDVGLILPPGWPVPGQPKSLIGIVFDTFCPDLLRSRNVVGPDCWDCATGIAAVADVVVPIFGVRDWWAEIPDCIGNLTTLCLNRSGLRRTPFWSFVDCLTIGQEFGWMSLVDELLLDVMSIVAMLREGTCGLTDLPGTCDSCLSRWVPCPSGSPTVPSPWQPRPRSWEPQRLPGLPPRQP